MNKTVILIILILLIRSGQTYGQSTYNMSNNTVTDCYGTFLDSDNGTPGTNYDHNEDYTFSICPPGAAQVTMTFSTFCTESNIDTIRFFDGPDTNSTLILKHSGSTLPGTITANSGCLTIHFKSDKNIACTGWQASWTVNLNPPVAPKIKPLANTPCFSQNIILDLDQYIPCDSIYPGAFSLSGPGNPVITNAKGVGCTSPGDTTNSITLTVNPVISKNGSYSISFVYRYKDICDSVWVFNIQQGFQVSDCPIEAMIQASEDTICAGECITLTGLATGGDPPTYAYNWNNGLPSNAGPHSVCPTTTTTYRLIVSDQGPSPSDTAFKKIVVTAKPNAGTDFTICESASPLTLGATPGGGGWQGTGITITSSGLFDPGVAGGGTHQLIYTLNGCSDTVEATVKPVNAGPDEAACPGSAVFQVTGQYPPGGTWSGSNISSGGTFTPGSPGIFPVTYTAPNGCSGTKDIYVDTITLQGTDTTCVNLTAYNITFTPYGGVWSGTGIADSLNGVFNPSLAGPGSHTLTYTLNGCKKTLDITVQNIQTGNNFTACPFEGQITLSPGIPSGGYWTGTGIVDSVKGIYDPSVKGSLYFNEPLVYHYQGCVDTVLAVVRKTNIAVDTLFFCVDDPFIYLNWTNVKRTPGDGQWSGPGVTDPDFPGKFDPATAGSGVHKLHYLANTCMDSMIMMVYDLPQAVDTTVCETSPPFKLSGNPSGGIWRGKGITDSIAGIFNPGKVGPGTYEVEYDTYVGCRDTLTVTVDPLANIQISGLAQVYCYKDTSIPVNATPTGGYLTGPGITGNFFNPLLAGPGSHTIKYHYGSGDCAVSGSVKVFVQDSISVIVPFTTDSICYGEKINITAGASGGSGGSFSFYWNGIGTGQSISVSPGKTTTYQLTVRDGCSEPAIIQITVYVFPEITHQVKTGPEFCYGDTGYAKIIVPPGRDYDFEWQLTPPQSGDSIGAPAGSYQVDIADAHSGCNKTVTVDISGYDFINAKFSINPNLKCLSFLDPRVDFIDVSTGGESGWWSFGDGDTVPYNQGSIVSHSYDQPGTYLVTLFIQNDGGCWSKVEQEVCIEAAKTLWTPTAITPNGDGHNDLFLPKGVGIETYHLMIFNRWGQKLFETKDIDQGWDGTYLGKRVQNDAYVFVIQYKDITSIKPRILKGSFAVIW